MMSEEPPPALDQIYLWQGSRPGVTIAGSYFGRAMLTHDRMLFLSTGRTARGLGWVFEGGRRLFTRTESLDPGDPRPGSISLALDEISRSEVVRRWDSCHYLLVEGAPNRGFSGACFLMPKSARASASRLSAFRDRLEALRSRRARQGIAPAVEQ
jgi:hypothetical protein